MSAKYSRTQTIEVWEDLRSPATSINPPGLISDPDWDVNNVGWLFDGTSTELLFIIQQMPHSWVEGSNIIPHIHWTQSEAGVVVWQLEYKMYNLGDPVPPSFTTLRTTSTVFPYTSGDIAQVSPFLEIDMSGMKISTFIKMKISRLGGDAEDTINNDVLFDEFDFHYKIDTFGSDKQFLKLNVR